MRGSPAGCGAGGNEEPAASGILEADERSPEAGSSDLTGRTRIARNVLSSWGGYLVFVVAGFVMPPLIDRRLGQSALGVWDLGWSLMSYFSLAQIGLGSSVNRYIARYRVSGDHEGVRRTASSVACLSLGVAFVVVVLTLVAVLLLPSFLGRQLGANLAEARWVVALLGTGLAVQMALDVSRGVITGCHRWDLHNAINSGSHAVTVAAMLATLELGGGLAGLAAANLLGVTVTEVVRLAVAHRVCPELRIRATHVDWTLARAMLVFGSKTSAEAIARLVLLQGAALVVAGRLGVAALAVYARPSAILHHVETFANKFAFVLTPTASSLQASGKQVELRELFIWSTRLGACLSVPVVLALSILGGPILRLWMGPSYEQGAVIAILAVGSLMPLTQRPVIAVLNGLNAHGPVAAASLVAAACGVGLTALTVTWHLPGVALAVAIALTLGNGLFVPVHACRLLGVPLGEYCRTVYLRPILHAAPFALCLVLVRFLLAERPLLAVVAGAIAGGLVLTPFYWRYVIPSAMRDTLAARAVRLLDRVGLRP